MILAQPNPFVIFPKYPSKTAVFFFLGGVLGCTPPEPLTFEIENRNYTSCWISQGVFKMGNATEEHTVRISHDLYMMKTEITQKFYSDLLIKNPSGFSQFGEKLPVERVSWYDAIHFANALSQKEGREHCYTVGEHQVNAQDG